MDPLLVISPHLDDAVLGAGQLMAGRPDCLVVTIFAGLPIRRRMLTTYDRDCGFDSAGAAIRERRSEDNQALAVLSACPHHLRYPDHQYREHEPEAYTDPVMIAEELLEIVDTNPLVTTVMGPLGLAHPDHLITADAFRLLLDARPHLDAWLYEDLPARVLWPQQVQARFDRWRDAGYDAQLDFLGTGPLGVKEDAVLAYRSQIGALRAACLGNLYPVLIPERHHSLRRS